MVLVQLANDTKPKWFKNNTNHSSYFFDADFYGLAYPVAEQQPE